jgi:hypothetical protein
LDQLTRRDSPPHRDAEAILWRHIRALERLDTGECPFGYTMPDEATERAMQVARHYLSEIQGDYYMNLYAYV